MDVSLDGRRPRLVLRFVIGAGLALLITGVGVTSFTVRSVRQRAEDVASFHARFVTSAVLAPALDGIPLDRPLSGSALERLDSVVRDRILRDGRDVRVKIWSAEGTILYSDYRPIVGRTLREEVPELHEVFEGHVESGVSDLTAAENVGERSIADKLFQTYVPLRRRAGGPIVAVAEVYQDYTAIQGDIDRLVRALSIVFAAGLAVLFAALLPIALRASRSIRAQNRALREQADQLGVLLAREQETVAELRDLNQRKNDFVSAASHELRTPLTSIIGYVRTLRRPEFADDRGLREEFLDAMDHQATHLLRLIKELLTSARLEDRADLAPELEPLDFRELAVAVAAEVELNGRAVIDVPLDLPPVVSDRERLHEVLVELLDNAIKYSPDGGSVEISARKDGEGFSFWVTDHGLGIEPEASAHVFERFYQADQSTTRQFGGLGLGLYLVRELVRELGGTISLESRPGEGSTFTVALPAE